MTLAERQTSANVAPDECGYCALALRTRRLWLICLSTNKFHTTIPQQGETQEVDYGIRVQVLAELPLYF